MRKNIIFNIALAFVFIAVSAGEAFAKHKHFKRKFHNKKLELSIKYLDPWGHTVADNNGIHYYHDKISNPNLVQVTHEYDKVLDPKYYDAYPLYYAGQTMEYELVIENKSKRRSYKNLLVKVFQEYLNEEGVFQGERLGPDAEREFEVKKIKPGEKVVLKGSINITGVTESGLDQTDVVIIKKWKKRKNLEGPNFRKRFRRWWAAGHEDDLNEVFIKKLPKRKHHRHRLFTEEGKIIFWQEQLGIWCPPGKKPE